MFYREDLFRAVGLPTDPEELAEYLADADRWLGAAALKRRGHFLFQQDSEPLDLLGMQEGFFDESLRYVRNTPPFVEMLEVARTVRGRVCLLGAPFGRSPAKRRREPASWRRCIWATGD